MTLRSLHSPALLSWSSGKDCAWTLHQLNQRGETDVAALVTTFNSHFQRVAMHGVRIELVRRQAASIGLPLWEIPLPWPCSNDEYEARMLDVLERATNAEIHAFAFGDLHLEDVRAYRERLLAPSPVRPLFPAWGLPTDTPHLARTMIDAGFRAILTCVDPRQLPAEFLGREFDEHLLADLPPTVDPCGERGEFHTFCYAGPIFQTPIPISRGEIVERDGFCFIDLLPADDLSAPIDRA